MAIAAIKDEKISQRQASKRFKVDRSIISRELLADAGVAEINQTITLEERQKWHQDKADGMNISQIAKKYGRDRGTVSKELKKDPLVAKPAVKPIGMAREIVAREKKAISKQLKAVEGLVSLECQLRRSWKADQKRWEKAGRSVWQHNVQEAHDVISSNGCLAKHREILGLPEEASYLEVLDLLEAKAKSAMASIQWLKYLSGYTELPGAQP